MVRIWNRTTEDLCEMLAANISSQVNVLVETIGTKSWSKRLGIASDHTQRYKAEAGNLVLVDDSLGQLDCTSPDTLADFISWGAENYPANRYILIFWDQDRYTALDMTNTSRRIRCLRSMRSRRQSARAGFTLISSAWTAALCLH